MNQKSRRQSDGPSGRRPGQPGSTPGPILRSSFTLFLALGLAMGLVTVLSGGCSEEEECPACPQPGIVIDRIHSLSDTVAIGEDVHLWAIATGENLEYRWLASGGEFQRTSSYYALWRAPDDPTIAELTVVVSNDDESATYGRDIIVGPYLPRHEPTYTGAGYCGLECHSVDGHGSNYDSWVNGRHATAFDRVTGSSSSDDWCAACHAVGYGDVDSIGWVRHNGGYDETPIAKLEGVQCENCHGPLADRYGEILDDHGMLAIGDSLLLVGTSDDPIGCGYCHERFQQYIPHTSRKAYVSEWETSAHAQSATDPSTHDPACARCHTAQGFITYMETGATLDEPSESPVSIVCAACHDPHSNRHPADLRAGYDGDVCSHCHSDAEGGYPDYPGSSHAPQAQLLAGEGGYEYDGVIFESSPHVNVAQSGCATCHYPASAGLVSHSFAADPAACTACHPGAVGTSFGWCDGMAEVGSLLAALADELDRATPEDQGTDEYERALFNWSFVNADGSSGAHNYQYAKQLIEAAIEDFEPSGER